MIENYLTFLNSGDLDGSVDRKMEEFLQRGVVYICGRDIKCRPIIWINISKLPKNNSTVHIETFRKTLFHVLIIA
jgi:hypothetical protein